MLKHCVGHAPVGLSPLLALDDVILRHLWYYALAGKIAGKLQVPVPAKYNLPYSNPNLSVKERQVQRNLRLELARRKENGESDIFICRGHIVKQHHSGHSWGSTLELMDDQSA